MKRVIGSLLFPLLLAATLRPCAAETPPANATSVKPGINENFLDPHLKAEDWLKRFEVESREIYSEKDKVLAACGVKPGMTVADIGAGTGLYTRLFAQAAGETGRVFAVEIAPAFLQHIVARARQEGHGNITAVLSAEDSVTLPDDSVDFAFICDTYHHFEFPLKTMKSLFQAMKPGGRVILVDFKRIEGESSEWTLNHVRAGQEVFEAEVLSTGFQKVREERELLKENYFVVFQKPEVAPVVAASKLAFPVIATHGGVVNRPTAADQPRAGAKVVFDVTADAKPTVVNKGLDRVARLLNLYGASGLQEKDVTITVVLHGEATKTALNDSAYLAHFEVEQNPNLSLIRELQKAGVEVLVCGQALNYKNFADEEVAQEVRIAAAAITVIINRQLDGYTYVPVH